MWKLSPGKQLPLSQAVVHHGVVVVPVPEGDGDGRPQAGGGVVHVVDGGGGCGVAGHGVHLPADDEGVGHGGLSDVGLPALLHLQGVGVQLRDHDGPFRFAGGVDGPQPLLVHGQVDVRVAPPRVGVLAVEAGVGEVPAGCGALRGQVVADEGSAAASSDSRESLGTRWHRCSPPARAAAAPVTDNNRA